VIVALVIVPPVIVAVEVKAPLNVPPACVAVVIVPPLIVGEVRVLLVSVCAPPVPTTSPVTLCAVLATSCARDSVKSLADTPCSTIAPML